MSQGVGKKKAIGDNSSRNPNYCPPGGRQMILLWQSPRPEISDLGSQDLRPRFRMPTQIFSVALWKRLAQQNNFTFWKRPFLVFRPTVPMVATKQLLAFSFRLVVKKLFRIWADVARKLLSKSFLQRKQLWAKLFLLQTRLLWLEKLKKHSQCLQVIPTVCMSK